MGRPAHLRKSGDPRGLTFAVLVEKWKAVPLRLAATAVAIVTFFLVMSPYLAWQALRYRKYIGSLRQRFGYLPISFNLDGEQSIWIGQQGMFQLLRFLEKPMTRDLIPANPDQLHA